MTATRLAGSQRDKGKRIWTVKSFTHQHESPVEAARIAHSMCDEYTERYNKKHTDGFQRTALVGVTPHAVLVFSPFGKEWVCMVSATFEAMTYERKRSMSIEPDTHATIHFDTDVEPLPEQDYAEQQYAVLVH